MKMMNDVLSQGHFPLAIDFSGALQLKKIRCQFFRSLTATLEQLIQVFVITEKKNWFILY